MVSWASGGSDSSRIIVVFVLVVLRFIMVRACRRCGGCVGGWIFMVSWGSGGSWDLPIELVLEWVGEYVPCDFSLKAVFHGGRCCLGCVLTEFDGLLGCSHCPAHFHIGIPVCIEPV